MVDNFYIDLENCNEEYYEPNMYEKVLTNNSIDISTIIDGIRKNALDYDEEIDAYSIGDSNKGLYIQFQDRESHETRMKTSKNKWGHEYISGVEDKQPRVKSNTLARIWEDGELVAKFEGSKFKVRKDVIDWVTNYQTKNNVTEDFTDDFSGDWDELDYETEFTPKMKHQLNYDSDYYSSDDEFYDNAMDRTVKDIRKFNDFEDELNESKKSNRINIVESLKKFDTHTNNKYDLYNLYESKNYN